MKSFLLSSALIALSCAQNNSTSQWTTLASLPHVWQEHSTTVIPSTQTIYVFGGVAPPARNGSFIDTIADVAAYDISSNSWKFVSPLPIPLNHANTAVVNDKIYSLGGLTNGTSWVATPRCFEFDPKANAWTELAPMPADQARGSSAMGVHDGRIILAGGMRSLTPSPGGLQDSVTTVTMYDPSCGNWTKMPDLPAPRDHVGGAIIGDKMFILGGRDHGQFNWRNTTWSLDLKAPEQGW